MKKLAILFAPLLGIILLAVISVNFGIGKVTDLRSKIAKERKNENILAQKLALLNEVAATVGQSSLAATALPVKNPSLVSLTQVKLLALNSGLLLSNIKGGVGGEDATGLFKVDIGFDIEGSRGAVFQFMGDVEKFAPISKVQKVKINEGAGVTRASVTVRSFFAPPPQKLPALTDSVKGLTEDEKATITDVLGLTQPVFLELPPAQEGGRVDPFNP